MLVNHQLFSARCNFRVCLLAFLWLVSIVLGASIAIYSTVFSSLMRMCISTHVSIVGLVVILFLPFVITVFSIYYNKPVIIYCLSTIKAFYFGVSLALIHNAFRNGCWLLLPLALFSTLVGNIFLLHLWIKYIGEDKQFTFKNAIVTFTGILTTGIIDYFIISPFLAEVMNRC